MVSASIDKKKLNIFSVFHLGSSVQSFEPLLWNYLKLGNNLLLGPN